MIVAYHNLSYFVKFGKTEGRTWEKTREKAKNKFDIRIKDTFDLIEKIENNELPDKIMINVHPQRWNDPGLNWCKELMGQHLKNMIKRIIIHRRGAKNAKKKNTTMR